MDTVHTRGKMLIKITSADKYFSYCVRERANWKCESCNTQYTPPTTGLQCAHIFGRKNKAVRIDPLNALALCAYCHQNFTANPLKFAEFVKLILKDNYDILLEKSNNITLGKQTFQAIKDGSAARHYLSEYERMKEIRSQGIIKRLEFTGLY